ncbi:MAG: DUF3060 domain-containing protein [Propionibacteriaceae bacterium]|nr:DUF3060 domain-containing protein [Propionibacteriaceae bacterium]
MSARPGDAAPTSAETAAQGEGIKVGPDGVSLPGVSVGPGGVRIDVPSDSTQPAPSQAPANGTCDGAQTVTGNYATVHFEGHCPSITVRANSTTITFGSVDELIVQGSYSTIRGGDVRSLTVVGSSNGLEVGKAETLTIDGPYNEVGSHGDLGKVMVMRDSNKVGSAGAIGGVTVSGNYNIIVGKILSGSIKDSGRSNEIRRAS